MHRTIRGNTSLDLPELQSVYSGEKRGPRRTRHFEGGRRPVDMIMAPRRPSTYKGKHERRMSCIAVLGLLRLFAWTRGVNRHMLAEGNLT